MKKREAIKQINHHCGTLVRIIFLFSSLFIFLNIRTNTIFIIHVYQMLKGATLSSIDETVGIVWVGRSLYTITEVLAQRHNSPSHNYGVLGPVLLFLSLSLSHLLPYSFFFPLSPFLSPLLSFFKRLFINCIAVQGHLPAAGIGRVSPVSRHLVNNRNNILSPIHDTQGPLLLTTRRRLRNNGR